MRPISRLAIAGLFIPALLCHAQQGDLDRLNNLFIAQFHQQRYALALRTATEALDVARATLAGNDPLLATVLENLAMATAQKGRYERAADLYRQALDIHIQHIDASDAPLIRCLYGLGNIHYWIGSFYEARQYYSHAIRLALGGRLDRVELAQSLSALAEVEYEERRYTDATYLMQHAITTYVVACGHGDPLYRGAELRLASIYVVDRRADEAAATYHRAIANIERNLGRLHPSLAALLSGLACLEAQRGNFAEAVALCERVVEIDLNEYGESSPAYAAALGALADHYVSARRFQEAEPLAERTVELWQGMRNGDPLNTARALDRLAGVYDRNGRAQDADAMYQRAIDLTMGLQDASCVVLYMRHLSALYVETGRPAMARSLLERGLRIAASRRLSQGDRDALETQYHAVLEKLDGTTPPPSAYTPGDRTE